MSKLAVLEVFWNTPEAYRSCQYLHNVVETKTPRTLVNGLYPQSCRRLFRREMQAECHEDFQQHPENTHIYPSPHRI